MSKAPAPRFLPADRGRFAELLKGLRPYVEHLDSLCQPGAVLDNALACKWFFNRQRGPVSGSLFFFDGTERSVGRFHMRTLESSDDFARISGDGFGREARALLQRTYFRDMGKAFSTLTGRTPRKYDRDFLHLCRRGLPEPLSKLLLRARYACPNVIANSLPGLVHACGGGERFGARFLARLQENPALAAAWVLTPIPAKRHLASRAAGVEAFSVLKTEFCKKGLGRGGFAWLSHQSWDWVLRAASSVGIVNAARLRLTSAQLRIPGVSRLVGNSTLERILKRELACQPACRVDLSGADGVLDFLLHSIPFEHFDDPAGLPDPLPLPDHLRWSGLKRMSDEWHEKIQLKSAGKLVHFPVLPVPEDLAHRLRVDEVEQLTDSLKLHLESRNQRHCVSALAPRCMVGDYCVFSLVCNRERHTAGFSLDRDGRWTLDQIKRSCNRPPLQPAVRAARRPGGCFAP